MAAPDADFSLDVLLTAVEKEGGADDGYVVFGSTVLWLHGIRVGPPGDVDVFVRPELWEAWAGRRASGAGYRRPRWRTLAPREGDPPFLELDLSPHPPIHAFYAWTARDEWMSVERCFELAQWVMDVRCVPVAEVRRHKVEAHAHSLGAADHAKHLRDVELIDRAGRA